MRHKDIESRVRLISTHQPRSYVEKELCLVISHMKATKGERDSNPTWHELAISWAETCKKEAR